MIHDTSAQDRALPRHGNHKRLFWMALVAVAVVAAVMAAPGLQRRFAADSSVSASRLVVAAVECGAFVRDIAAEGKVVAAVSPTLYAANPGAATLKVKDGDTVKKGQVVATIDSPELAARLAQEQSNADAMRADHLRAQVDARQQQAALQSAFDNARIDKLTAENDLTRQQRAFDAGAVAGMQVDRARDTLAKAGIALAQAQGGLHLKEDSLKFDVQAKQLAHARQLLLVADLQRQVAELQVRSPVLLPGALPAEPGWFDPVQIEQALINLLKNAVEAGGPADGVTLAVIATRSEMRFEVADRGPGMNDAVLAQALLPFYSTKRAGTGLGLALAREIAEAHGGRIALLNRADGPGLRVTLSVPAAST